ncbi:flagellar filament capping protein FliD [Comamonas antarctica]|uniref:flagellar filament capping protein FliD n=1 Tax=Comamonas antarctica TaxID=2743470 RepID=UPI0028E97A1C|nr:flagellar filament capping protein FliD [Comamonas antarctica]
MAVTSVGLGSGLEVDKIVSQLVELEKAPLKTLEVKADTISSKISIYAEIKSLADTLNTATAKLSRDSAWNGVNIASSSSSVVGAMTGIAQPGSYSVEVKALATSQSSVIGKAGADKGFDKDEKVGAGTFTLTVGGKDFPIALTASDTLTTMATAINNQNSGVQATVITNADGTQRLMMRAQSTGTAAEFSVKASATDPASSSILASLGKEEAGYYTVSQKAQNALIKLNGVEVESTSNTFSDALSGMSLTVSTVSTSPALVTVTADTASMKESVQAFVDAYNALNDKLSELTKYNAESEVAGLLQGDGTTVSMQNALRMLTMGVVKSGTAFTRLSDIGIQMQQGGNLSVNETDLTKALTDLPSLKSVFATKADSLGAGGGIAVNFKAFTDGLLAYEGTLNTKTDSLESSLKRNGEQQDKVTARASTLEARLLAQYSALDVKMASLNALDTYVTQQIASWNKSTS